MRRASLVVAVVVLLTAIVAPVGPALGANDTYVSITGATVTPTSPAPGDLVTVTATLKSLPSGSSTFDIEYIRLTDDSGRVLDYAGQLGSLAPGSEIQVPLTDSFKKAGTYHLRVEAVGHTSNGVSQTVKYPVVVRVRPQAPAVQVVASNPVAGAASPVNVTVANGLDEPIRNVRVSLAGKSIGVDPTERVGATIGAGASTTDSFDVTASGAGTHNLTATVRYTTANGDRQTQESVPVSFASLHDHVQLSTKRVGDGSSLAVTVSDLGNADVRHVSVRGTSANATVTGGDVARVPAGASRTVVLNASGLSGEAPVHVVASYDYGRGTHTGRASTNATVSANPGSIRLTGLDVEHSNGKTHITGSASNVGLAAVNSVVVSVVPAAGVTPAYPGREYFVGTVPKSDFVSFDVYATVDPNATSVPLRVTYLADGAHRTKTVQVPIAATGTRTDPSKSPGSGGGGWLFPAAIGVVVLAAIGGLIYVGWRNRANDE